MHKYKLEFEMHKPKDEVVVIKFVRDGEVTREQQWSVETEEPQYVGHLCRRTVGQYYEDEESGRGYFIYRIEIDLNTQARHIFVDEHQVVSLYDVPLGDMPSGTLVEMNPSGLIRRIVGRDERGNVRCEPPTGGPTMPYHPDQHVREVYAYRP